MALVSNKVAQEKPTESKDMQIMMKDDDMHKCKEKIAGDSTMRMEMMKKCKDDKEGMMESEMMKHNMMDKMEKKGCCSGMMDHKMMKDSTKTMDKSEHESHHQKKQ